MIIEYVNPINLNLLEDAFRSGIMETRDITKDFGKNLSLLLSHIKISFVISEISIFEAYNLKRFCDGNLIDLKTYMNDNKIDKDRYPITHRCIQSLFLLNKTINDDKDIAIKPGVSLFPAKCIEKKCIATFQGNNILSLTGALVRGPESFFIKIDRLMKSSPNRSKEDIINDTLIELFFKEFYKYIGYKFQYMDILTDSALDYAYLSTARNNTDNLVSLSHINSIYGYIPLINVNNDEYTSSLNKLKKNKKLITTKDNSILMESTEVFFICNTSFYSFMEAFLYLPIGCILESTDIKVLYSSDQYIIPKELIPYQSRIKSIIEKMKTERLDVLDILGDHNADNYNLIPLNVRIQYSIKFKLSEISDILLNWENKIVEEHIYGDENNYLSKELLKIVTTMKELAIAVYNTIIN